MATDENIIKEYLGFLNSKAFPCIAAKAALARDQIKCMVSEDMSSSSDDHLILEFLYKFVDHYRISEKPFNSAAIIFKQPSLQQEAMFDKLLWERLNALSSLDKKNYAHDKRVSADPASEKFSFSLKEEAFFIIGLHPLSNRKSRVFRYPTLVFNPHEEFERLKKDGRYEQMKKVVRKRDTIYSGSVNPMLSDFGEASEVYQYSGAQYDSTWQCPLRNKP